jgi:hypothetical protein
MRPLFTHKPNAKSRPGNLSGIDFLLPLANTNSDSGNLMRYDATGSRYIFNWNTTGLTDGKHRIHMVLGEGSCAPERTADVTFKRK